MTPLGNLFHQWRAGRTCFMGLGNPDYGDDGFGVQLADELTKAGIPEVVIGGAVPEQRLGKIAAQDFDYVVFLDAVDFAAPPGSLVVMGARQNPGAFPADFDSQDLTFGSGGNGAGEWTNQGLARGCATRIDPARQARDFRGAGDFGNR